jgi:hypothetical protein
MFRPTIKILHETHREDCYLIKESAQALRTKKLPTIPPIVQAKTVSVFFSSIGPIVHAATANREGERSPDDHC